MGAPILEFLPTNIINKDEAELTLEIICDKCGGSGRICTFSCVINSSGDSYEKCGRCNGKGYLYKKQEFTMNLMHIPNYVYWKNKALSLQDDISELLKKQ